MGGSGGDRFWFLFVFFLEGPAVPAIEGHGHAEGAYEAAAVDLAMIEGKDGQGGHGNIDVPHFYASVHIEWDGEYT